MGIINQLQAAYNLGGTILHFLAFWSRVSRGLLVGARLGRAFRERSAPLHHQCIEIHPGSGTRARGQRKHGRERGESLAGDFAASQAEGSGLEMPGVRQGSRYGMIRIHHCAP